MKIFTTLAALLFLGSSFAMASEAPAEDAPTSGPIWEMALPERSENAKRQRPYEIQTEYLAGRFFKARNVDRYNVHIFEQVKQNGSVTIHRGLTIARMTGNTTEDGIYRDSGAWGIGPSVMIRWEKPLSGKLYGGVEGSGTFEIYNHAHPGGARCFGFHWRAGPRLTYRCTEREALSLGYIFHHTSNGMRTHNPGYNGIGFSLGYHRSF